jgi:uncharacterized protein (TIGR00266 family)
MSRRAWKAFFSTHTPLIPMIQIYYAGPNREQLTTTEDALPELLRNGTLTLQTLVWKSGWPNWQPLSVGFPHLAGAAPSPGSAPPSVPTAFSGNTTSAEPVFSGRTPAGRRSHEIDYKIIGEEMQIVEIELDPGEVVIAEAGAMNYMDPEIQFETKMGDGSNPNPSMWDRLKQVGKRMLTGESLFMTHFTNRGQGKKQVAFAAPYPGHILPMDLSQYGGRIICQKDSFLCAAMGTQVGIAFAERLGAGFFGGEGFILQKLEGDGLAFVHAGGTVIKKELRGDMVLVDTGCLVAFTPGIEYNIQRAGNLKSMLFGGEGLFLASLRGHGTVWIQSLPLSKLAGRILANATGRASNDSGSLLGNLFES